MQFFVSRRNFISLVSVCVCKKLFYFSAISVRAVVIVGCYVCLLVLCLRIVVLVYCCCSCLLVLCLFVGVLLCWCCDCFLMCLSVGVVLSVGVALVCWCVSLLAL